MVAVSFVQSGPEKSQQMTGEVGWFTDWRSRLVPSQALWVSPWLHKCCEFFPLDYLPFFLEFDVWSAPCILKLIYSVFLAFFLQNREAESGSKFKVLQGSQVIMSVPGAHSRKPPLQSILACDLSPSVLFIFLVNHLQWSICSVVNAMQLLFYSCGVIYGQSLTCKRNSFRIYSWS